MVRMAESGGKGAGDLRLCLLGFGSVGQEFVAMLRDVGERIASTSGIRFLITGVTAARRLPRQRGDHRR